MTIDTYGLSFEKYKEFFYEEATRTFNLYAEFSAACDKTDVKLSEKTKYDLFSETVYAANDDARAIQKKEDPDSLKDHGFDYVSPIKEEIREELKTLNEKIDALSQHVENLMTVLKAGLTDLVD